MDQKGTFLQFTDILGSRPLRTFDHIEAYTIPFGQGAEPLRLDRRMMDEYILAAILLDETIPL